MHDVAWLALAVGAPMAWPAPSHVRPPSLWTVAQHVIAYIGQPTSNQVASVLVCLVLAELHR